jgi:iron-sulfur cluster assembly protein
MNSAIKEGDTVLDVTPNASQVIREMVVRNDNSGVGGLRIAPTQSAEGGFSLSVAEAPEPDDSVVAAQDAEVFLEPSAAAALDDKVLDASVNPEGKVYFSVADQTGTDLS